MAELVYALVLGTSGATLGSSSLPPSTLDIYMDKCYTIHMKKINNKSINLSLKILTIFAFALIFVPFNKAAAQSDCFHPDSSLFPSSSDGSSYSNYGNYNNSYYNPPYQAPVYIAPAPAVTPVVNSTTVNPNPVMIVSYVPTKTVAVAKTKPKTVATVTNPNTGNALAANAVYGSNGFLPSGIIQWILFGIAILLIVILGRTVFGAKNNYHSTPLKHE